MTFELTLEAAEPMPATIGWHPWFRRTLEPGGPPVAVDFAADEMLVRDAEGLPTGERVPPPPGPWDDAFTGVHRDPALTWPGTLRLTLSSTCPWWVVYTAPPNAGVRRAPERPARRRQRRAGGRRARPAADAHDALELGPPRLSAGRYLAGSSSGGRR